MNVVFYSANTLYYTFDIIPSTNEIILVALLTVLKKSRNEEILLKVLKLIQIQEFTTNYQK